MAGAAGAIMFARSAGGLLLPVLATTVQGSNTGGAITAGATGYAFVIDTAASATPPSVVSGYADLGTAIGTSVSARLSGKAVTSGESITANSGSRRQVRIYTNVDAGNPIDAFASDGGDDANADVPTITISAGGRLVVGFIRRAGSGVLTWASPLNQNVASQNTTAVLTSAESAGLLTTYAGQAVAVSNNQWCAAAFAINGVAA